MIRKFINSIFFVSLAFILFSCGGSGGNSEDGWAAPYDAVITFDTGDIALVRTAGDIERIFRLRVIVKNSQGIPLENVQLTINYLFAVPNPGNYIHFIDDSERVDAPMNVKTNINGIYDIEFYYWSGNSFDYTADITVTSGSVSNSVEFAVASTA